MSVENVQSKKGHFCSKTYSVIISGFIKILCRRSVGFFSWAFLVFLMKESKKRRQKQPDKLMAKYLLLTEF